MLGRLARLVGEFLMAQVSAGAQVLQLFDSWSGALAPSDFREFALPYMSEAVRHGSQGRSAGHRLLSRLGLGAGGDRPVPPEPT